MFKAEKKQLKKIKYRLRLLPLILGERAFLTSLVLFFIAVILGGAIFYKYSILAEQREAEFSEKLLYFDEKNLQEVLVFWQARQTKFQEADSKQYVNSFKIEQ